MKKASTSAFDELLPSPDAGPEAAYARGVLLDELDAALDELPEEQREVFVAHESRDAVSRSWPRNRPLREHAALEKTLCGAAFAAAPQECVRRIHER